MDSLYFLLQKIRKSPRNFLGEKSLKVLMHFLDGYAYGSILKAREVSTGHCFFEDYEEAIGLDLLSNPYGSSFLNGFDEFIHSYYNDEETTLRGVRLILEYSDSESEAFDHFFELLDMFLELKKTGTWGAGLYQNNVGQDVQTRFVGLESRKKGIEEITQILIDEYADMLDNPDIGPSFWFALADIQRLSGRLLPEVKKQALAWLDKGGDLEKWQRDYPNQAAARKKILQELKDQLVAPQFPPDILVAVKCGIDQRGA